MKSLVLTTTSTLLIAAATLPAATIFDNFTGNNVDGSIWTGGTSTEGQGLITPLNNRLEFTAGPAASLVDGNHLASYQSPGLVSAFDDWTATVQATLATSSDFGTFGANDGVLLTFQIENSADTSDRFALSFISRDTSGTVGQQVSASKQTDSSEVSQSTTLFPSEVGSLSLILSYEAATTTLSASYLDTSEILLSTFDLSDWNFGSDGALNLNLEGAAQQFQDSNIQSGTFDVTSGEAYFDSFSASGAGVVPEPGASILIALAALTGGLRRRR